jgi:hypothetical protein
MLSIADCPYTGGMVMAMQFLQGNSQAPKGHAILIAYGLGDPRTIFCTYCVVPPIPMSIAKWRDATSMAGTPIPPILEEATSLEYLKMLAERRGDDLCDIGTVSSKDEMTRMQMAITSSHEYGMLYASYLSTFSQDRVGFTSTSGQIGAPVPLDELDAEELLLQTMSDRQKLAELGKLIGTARYALGGRDTDLLQETRQKMQNISHMLPDKYRGTELVNAAINQQERGAKLAELYLSRAYKLLDEEYAEIPAIERSIRELQD